MSPFFDSVVLSGDTDVPTASIALSKALNRIRLPEDADFGPAAPAVRKNPVVVLQFPGALMIRSLYVLVLVAMAAGSASLQAQARPQPQDPKSSVPRTHLPPPGMCRIWLDNVPPSQQPAPTDCASAVRNQPRNGRVIFNDEPRNSNPRLPIVKSLKEPVPTPPRKAPDAPAPAKPPPKPVKPDRPEPRG